MDNLNNFEGIVKQKKWRFNFGTFCFFLFFSCCSYSADLKSVEVPIEIKNVEEMMLEISNKYDLKLSSIEKENLEMKSTITELRDKVSTLEGKINESRIFNVKKILCYIVDFSKMINQKLLAGLALLLIIWWSYLNYKQNKSLQFKDSPIKNYCFGGEDEIGAKLDLAQAYIDIGDKKLARDVLLEVIKNGDKNQISKAKEFLIKCE